MQQVQFYEKFLIQNSSAWWGCYSYKKFKISMTAEILNESFNSNARIWPIRDWLQYREVRLKNLDPIPTCLETSMRWRIHKISSCSDTECQRRVAVVDSLNCDLGNVSNWCDLWMWDCLKRQCQKSSYEDHISSHPR